VTVRPAALLGLSLLCACGGGLQQVDGEVAGYSLDAHEAVLNSVRDPDTGAAFTQVLIGDIDRICDQLSGGLLLSGQTILFMSLAIAAPEGAFEQAGSAGRFDVVPDTVQEGSRVASVLFLKMRPGCGADANEGATGGTVTVTHAAPALAAYTDEVTELAASIDLVFPHGHITGRFSAVRCDQLEGKHLLACL